MQKAGQQIHKINASCVHCAHVVVLSSLLFHCIVLPLANHFDMSVFYKPSKQRVSCGIGSSNSHLVTTKNNCYFCESSSDAPFPSKFLLGKCAYNSFVFMKGHNS